MADLLVKLYGLPASAPVLEKLAAAGIEIKRAIGPERRVVADLVLQKFSKCWASETDCAFSQAPATCFVAVKGGKPVGFACYDTTSKGFFGPIGVDEAERTGGIGKALLLRTLEAMREAGYGYAVVGWAGPVDFFKKAVGAVVIEGSEPGVYKNLIK